MTDSADISRYKENPKTAYFAMQLERLIAEEAEVAELVQGELGDLASEDLARIQEQKTALLQEIEKILERERVEEEVPTAAISEIRAGVGGEEAGRADWTDLGFLEAKVDLVNANTGERGSLVTLHPGGGSAYALSYRPQKILESMSGGEKPNVVLIGHYHKLSVNLIRNVWAIQVGCTQDQTIFMRKKNIEAHVGGVIVDLEQDPKTGAIVACTPTLIRYFDAAYYNDRWKKTGPVVAAERRAA